MTKLPVSLPAPLEGRRTLLLVLCLWLLVGCFLAWISAACLLGHVEYALSPDLIQGWAVARVALPATPYPWPVMDRLQVLEDGHPLGPQVNDAREVRGGAYATSVRLHSGAQRLRLLQFSSSDGSIPRRNGRSYVVRFPRRRLPGSIALLLLCWITLPGATVRLSRARTVASSDSGVSDVVGWSLLVSGGLYSLFAAQAWLLPANTSWLLLAAAPALAPFLARLVAGRVSSPTWLPWLAGLLVWALGTAFGGSSYASPATAGIVIAVSVGGLVLYFGFRGGLTRSPELGASMLLGLFTVVAASILVREAGFDLSTVLASVGLSSSWTGGVTNPWTTKFLSHWLLVVTWCTLAAMARSGRGDRWRLVFVAALGVGALWVAGSKSALSALVLSVAIGSAGLRWPAAVRRLLVSGLVVGVLLAPLLAGVPWRLHSALPSRLVQGPLQGLEMGVRGGVWEVSRRLISLHPWTGWGFGASRGLPVRNVPMHDVLGFDSASEPKALSRVAALPGGHPHNVALLTWLDLGLIGALLVAGLLVAVGRSIAGVEEHKRVHATLLGLLTVNATFLAFNYPAWEPEVQSILWMSVVLAAALLPRAVMGRRELFRDGLVVFLILAVGGTSLLWGQLSHWLTLWELRHEQTVLVPEDDLLLTGDEIRHLEYGGDLDAGAELVAAPDGSGTLIRGWAYGPPGAPTPEEVLVFVGSDLVGGGRPERPTPEVFARSSSRDVRALVSGFLLWVEPERVDLGAPVTVVALRSDGALARELPPLSASQGGRPRPVDEAARRKGYNSGQPQTETGIPGERSMKVGST